MNDANAQPILKLSTFHEMLANWILMNPGGTYRAMGAHFGYTVPWLCTVVNSDLFKAYMAERMKDVNAVVTEDIPTKLKTTALMAIERVQEVIEKSEDGGMLIDAFDKVMHRYGYAPNAKASPASLAPIVQQNNVFFIGREDLKDARKQLLEAHAPRILEGEKVNAEPDAPTPT